MKYICLFLFAIGCSTRSDEDSFPSASLVKRFSKHLNEETGMTLYCYGTHLGQSEESISRYGKKSFTLSYYVPKTQEDIESLENARCLLVSIVESLLDEINSDEKIKSRLNVYPLTYDWINLFIHYVDENKVEIGNGGISSISFWNGKIKYENYAIYEYTGQYPAQGNHSSVHHESYPEALEIVKQQGCLNKI